MPEDSLDTRLARLEAFLDRVTPSSARRTAAAAAATAEPPPLDPDVLDGLAATADRLRMVSAEIERRGLVQDWDAADGLTARLLTEHLAAAVRDCRVVATAATQLLASAEHVAGNIEQALDRQRDRDTLRTS